MTTDLMGSTDARLRLMAARVIAQGRWPYVSSLLFAFTMIETPHEQLSTMAVDKHWRLYYSPRFVQGETSEALATVLLHECLHCLHNHSDRFEILGRPAAEHPLWNYAGDAAINDVLDDANMVWPSVTPVRYSDLRPYGVEEGMPTEAAFFALRKFRDEHPGFFNSLDDCGSVAGGHPRDYERSFADDDYPGVRNDRREMIRDRVAHDILEHERSRGQVPGDLLRWARDVMSPRVNWREALASRIRRELSSVAGMRDYVYTRPSRRQEAMRLAGSTAILPAMRQPAPPRVACVVDTSGSVLDENLRSMLAEVVGIARAVGVAGGVFVIACDSQARPAQRVKSVADIGSLQLEGGGGTDMGEGIRAAAALRPKPHVIVVLTDGYTSWPDEPPKGINSLVVVLTDPHDSVTGPVWAHTIRLE